MAVPKTIKRRPEAAIGGKRGDGATSISNGQADSMDIDYQSKLHASLSVASSGSLDSLDSMGMLIILQSRQTGWHIPTEILNV